MQNITIHEVNNITQKINAPKLSYSKYNTEDNSVFVFQNAEPSPVSFKLNVPVFS